MTQFEGFSSAKPLSILYVCYALHLLSHLNVTVLFWIKKKKTSWLEAKERLFRGKRIRKPYKETKIFFFKFVID